MKDNPIRLEKLRKRQKLLDNKVEIYPHNWEQQSWGQVSNSTDSSEDSTQIDSETKDSHNTNLSKSTFKKQFNKIERSSSEQLIQKFKSSNEDELSNSNFFIAGRLMRKRSMGKAAFFTIQDQTGSFQCYIRKDAFLSLDNQTQQQAVQADQDNQNQQQATKIDQNSEQKSNTGENTQNQIALTGWDMWKLCDIGDIISVKGNLFKTKMGEPSLKVKDLKILCKTIEPLPEKYHGLENIELKYRFRHLDLIMNPKTRLIFEIRSKIIQEIRVFMNKQNFIEVETPVLQSVYGGAAAEPFETHFRRLNNQKMYLKISPEIYLKKLIVGGFEKVYEIGKNFRNEGIDRTHNPEFTMMEYYEAYTDYNHQMRQLKELVNHVAQKIKGSLEFEYQGKALNFKKWETLPIISAVKRYSQWEYLTDKQQQILTENNEDTKNKDNMSRDSVTLDPDKMSFEKFLNTLKKLEPTADYQTFNQHLKNKNREVKKPLDNQILADEEALKGELIVLAFELLAEKHLWNPTFITDFPLSVSPLTKKHRKHKNLVERFEPYIAGMELGNAYTELNDPVDQKQRLTSQTRWLKKENSPQEENNQKSVSKETFTKDEHLENSHPIDENFIHALEVGMPPTGGVGLGIERLVMILSDQKSIRDCILFPALKNSE